MNEDREQPFVACVIDALARRGVEIGQQWARGAGPAALEAVSGEDGGVTARGVAADEVVRAVLAAARGRGRSAEAATKTGRALGAWAHGRNVSLHEMLEQLDLLEAILLHAAERAAADHDDDGVAPREAVALARALSAAVSSLRLAAARGYTRSLEEELRGRYRAIRHDLRNPLGTIRSAIALLTDESLPPETRQSSRVRAMVARNTRSLDQMIGEALSDDAASLPALGPAAPGDADASGREQRDDLLRTRERPDLESGAL